MAKKPLGVYKNHMISRDGGDVYVTTPDGKTIKAPIPAGSASDKTAVANGKSAIDFLKKTRN